MDTILTHEREQIEKVIFSRKKRGIKQQLLCEVSVTTLLYHLLFVFLVFSLIVSVISEFDLYYNVITTCLRYLLFHFIIFAFPAM